MKSYDITSHIYGHPVYLDEDTESWHYMDGTPVPDNPADYRVCPECYKPPTPEGHDACLGTIPGVMFACCGHGVEDGYIRWFIPEMSAIEIEAPRWLRWLLRLTMFDLKVTDVTIRGYSKMEWLDDRAVSK